MKERKIYRFYYANLKYEGYLISMDDVTYTLVDSKLNAEVKLPKANTVVVEVKK